MQKKLANFEGFLFNQFFCQRYKGWNQKFGKDILLGKLTLD